MAVKIKSKQDLEKVFDKLVSAKGIIEAAGQDRDEKKRKADADYLTEIGEPVKELDNLSPAKVIEEFEPQAEEYCMQNSDELFPKGKKSGIIGVASVEIRTSPGSLTTKDGEKPDNEQVMEKIYKLKQKLSPKDYKTLKSCIMVKETLDTAAVKKLPEELLKKLGLTVKKSEIFSYKPNAER